MASTDLIEVLLPAYNEEDSLPPLVARINAALQAQPRPWEIVVVDDGSTDRTAEVVEELSRSFPIRLVRHVQNRGLGAAMRTGLLASLSASVVVTMDADDTHDPALIERMLRRLEEGNDVVIASRFETGGEEIGVPPHRRFLSHSASGLMRLLAPVDGVRDFSCGYRAYRTDFLRRVIDRYGRDSFVRENGFACMVELILKAGAVGGRIAEVPLVLQYDRKAGGSKMRVLQTARRYGNVLWAHHAGPAASRPQAAAAATAPRPVGRGARAVNVVAAASALVLTAPLMAAVALVMRWMDGGPILVGETRVGIDRRGSRGGGDDERRTRDIGGAPFTLLAFRTPTETRLGRLLRRHHLHGLPRLWNVLRGDMNLVGPRPVTPEMAVTLRQGITGYEARHAVKPGLTGLGQLHVPEVQGIDDLYRQVQFDFDYLTRRSAGEDLRILLRTVPLVFSRRVAA